MTLTEDWDSGDVIEIRKHPIDYSKSMLAYKGDVYDIGVHMARDAVDKIAQGRQMPKTPQDAKTSGYYTVPTAEELRDIRDSGIRLVDADQIISIVVESFASPCEQVKFRDYIQLAVQDWYNRNGVQKC